MHTTHLAVCFVEDNLRCHTVYDSEKYHDFNDAIDNAIKHLFNAYQIIGSIELGDENWLQDSTRKNCDCLRNIVSSGISLKNVILDYLSMR